MKCVSGTMQFPAVKTVALITCLYVISKIVVCDYFMFVRIDMLSCFLPCPVRYCVRWTVGMGACVCVCVCVRACVRE